MLSNTEKIAINTAMSIGDPYTRDNITIFPLPTGEYCIQKMDGPVTEENRVITQNWGEALRSFERFLEG